MNSAAALQHTLVRPYNGPGVAWLESALQKYIKMYDAGEHYGKTIVIMQSSGTGKSRTAAEFTTVCIGPLPMLVMLIHPRIPESTGESTSVSVVWDQAKICMTGTHGETFQFVSSSVLRMSQAICSLDL